MEYQALTDEERLAGVKNRIHMLEAQHFDQELFLEEADADPNSEDDVVLQHRKTMTSLEARLRVLRSRQSSLESKGRPVTTQQ